MRKLLLVFLSLLPLSAAAQVYNFFPPPNTTYNATTATLTLGNTGISNGAFNLFNGGGAANTRQLGMTYSSLLLNWRPLTDAGAPVSASENFAMQWGAGGSFQWNNGSQSLLVGNDLSYVAPINVQPLVEILDNGSTGALAGFLGSAGTLAANNIIMNYCTSNASTMGAGLTNGPTGGFCLLSTGDQILESGNPGGAPLLFGTNGIYAGKIDNSQNWTIGDDTSAAVTVTVGASSNASSVKIGRAHV